MQLVLAISQAVYMYQSKEATSPFQPRTFHVTPSPTYWASAHYTGAWHPWKATSAWTSSLSVQSSDKMTTAVQKVTAAAVVAQRATGAGAGTAAAAACHWTAATSSALASQSAAGTNLDTRLRRSMSASRRVPRRWRRCARTACGGDEIMKHSPNGGRRGVQHPRQGSRAFSDCTRSPLVFTNHQLVTHQLNLE